MRISNMFFKTYRENPVDAEIKSHKLLVRAGYIKKQSAGVYMFMPLGVKVLDKLCNVIKKEMDKAGAQQMQMTSLLPIETYSHRLEHFGDDMFRLQDRSGKEFCLGPSHEEVFTAVMKDAVTSYKQLPQLLYQIQTKFRDEKRPRFGLQRGREFLMKDAYSFDKDLEGLDRSYNIMSNAYKNIFTKLGLDFAIVDADNGSMGGNASQEFMVKNDIGEDEIVYCETCNHCWNTEKAACKFVQENITEEHKAKELKETPNSKTIEELVGFLNETPEKLLKAVVYKADNKNIIVSLVKGNREIEEVKLCRATNSINLEMASHEDIESIGSVAGFVGAHNLKNCKVIADNDVKNMVNFITGANKTDYHYINTNLEDLNIDLFADIKKAEAGDICADCGQPLQIIRGIEVGHIFKQQTTYTKNQECKFLDENGKLQYMQMGAYGIGVSRTMSAIVEQYSDDSGIIWPEIIAPYKYYIAIANNNDQTQVQLAEKIYNTMLDNDIEVMLDDRKESVGVKLKDAELIGIPYIIVVGRDAANNNVEFIQRNGLIKSVKSADEVINLK